MSKFIARAYWICLLFCFFSNTRIEAVICGSPVTISSPIGDQAQVGISATGNAIAIWSEFDGANTNIQYATLPKGGTWSAPINISTFAGSNPGSNPTAPQIAVDPAGNAVAIWVEAPGATSTVRSSQLSSGGTWTAPVDVSVPTTTTISGQTPQIAINSSDYVVAVWQRSNGVNNITQAATLQFGGSWSAPVDISTPLQDSAVPQVAIDGSGNAVAVWLNVTTLTIQGATLPFGGSWTSPVNISAVGGSGEPMVAMNPSGYAVATWERFNGSFFAAQASTMQFGGSWTTPIEISTPGSNAIASDVAVDLNGNAVAAWSQSLGLSIVIQSAYLPFGGTWSAPADLSAMGALSFDVNIAFDAFGNAFAVWDRDNGTDVVIQAAELPFGGSWISLCDLSTAGEGTIFPKIAVDPNGYAVVVWNNTTLQVVQSAQLISPPLPPSNFIGIVKKDKFLTQTSCVLKVTWTPSLSTDVVSYRIYKQGILVKVIPATAGFHATFHSKLCCFKHRDFEIAAVNSLGIESTRVPLVITKKKDRD